jgi:hypothetical protein
VSFLVESVALISRRGDEPFEVRYRVHLGQGSKGAGELRELGSWGSWEEKTNLMQLLNDLEPELSQEQRQHRETILALVEQACASVWVSRHRCI